MCSCTEEAVKSGNCECLNREWAGVSLKSDVYTLTSDGGYTLAFWGGVLFVAVIAIGVIYIIERNGEKKNAKDR